MAKQPAPIVGLDVGTTTVRVVIAEAIEGQFEIVGIGEAESRGLRKGVISKPDLAVDSIKRAVEAAERMAGLTVTEVYVALGGTQIKGFNSEGMIAIPGRQREISREEIKRVVETACAAPISAGREVADVLPQEYIVDDQDGIDDPLGMLGSRLAVSVHIVTSPIAAKQNVITCVNRAGFHVADVTIGQLAAGEAVLTDDDREYGSAVVNIGGETTSLAIYQRGAVWHTEVFPLGGSHFTNDIAFGLRTPIPEAERIKREHGCGYRPRLTPDVAAELIDVPSVGGREPRAVTRQLLCDIVEPRAEEMLAHVHAGIRAAGYERQLSSGIVLTGGGALLDGLVEVAEQVFDAPARIGIPAEIDGLADDIAQPGFATAVGLVLHGLRMSQGAVSAHRHQSRRVASGAVTDRLKAWLGLG
jgi:cell division protein FtsA